MPWIGEEEIAAVVEVLKSGWITTGPRVREFEESFASFLGCRHAVAVNSCTAALHLALEALGVGPGDEVLVPTMTFAATAEVVQYLGARPVLIDCDPTTLCLDVDRVAEYLEKGVGCRVQGVGTVGNRNWPANHGAARFAASPRPDRHPTPDTRHPTPARVRAVIPVHFAGLPCAMDRLLTLAARYGLAVVEDAAHAVPAEIGDRSVGTLGDAAAFSFYATKNLTTGEGGMLTTNDAAIAERARLMSLHGMSRDAWMRYAARGSWYYEILEAGYKYNMTDVAAALGLVQLGRSEALWAVRRRYAARYTEAFSRLPELETPPDAGAGDRHAWHLYVLRLNLDRLRINRAGFIEALINRGIGASVHFMPLHLRPFYRDTHGYQPSDLPVASAVYERILSLPLYPRMTEADLDRVIDAVKAIVRENAA